LFLFLFLVLGSPLRIGFRRGLFWFFSVGDGIREFERWHPRFVIAFHALPLCGAIV
jgi:hypothetical protein